MKTGDSDREDTGTPTERGGNVVRLPREWIGPLEELVPIRPASDANEPSAPLEEELPPTADAFWSEDAGALHNAVQAPVDRSAMADDRDAAQPARRWRPRLWLAGCAPPLRSRLGRVGVRQLGVVAVAVPLLAIAVIGTVWGPGGSGSRSTTGHHTLGQTSSESTLPHSALSARGSPSASTRRRAEARHSHRSERVRQARSRATTASRASKPAAGRGSAEAVSVTHVHPSTGSVSPPPTAGTGSEAPSGSSTAPASPTGSASSVSSASSRGTPAFGPSGALGPGSSPNS